LQSRVCSLEFAV